MAESRIRRLAFFAALSVFLCPMPVFSSQTAEGDRLILDAEELIFDESSGMAVAKGGASLVYRDIKMYAPVLEMDTNANRVRASSLEHGGTGVTVFSGGRVLKGSMAEFDLSSHEGVIFDTGVFLPIEDSSRAVRLEGSKVEVATAASARRKGWLPKRAKKISDDETVGRWEDASVTTCPLSSPHYRLKAKRLVLIPDQALIVKSPQVCMGGRPLFTYPFDYSVDLRDRKGAGADFMPRLDYDSDKGAGVGLSGPLLWDGGALTVSLMEWSGEDLEWRGRVDVELLPWLKIYGETAWEYESAADKKTYRPAWGFAAQKNGWTLSGRWSEREILREELTSGSIYRGSLWRSPEIELSSPWWRMSSDGVPREYLRFSAVWGRYEEAGSSLPRTERAGWSGELYGKIDAPAGRWEPFWRLKYRDFHYDVAGEDSQKVTDAAVGLIYKNPCGFEMGTAYSRRWVDGRSAFAPAVTADADSWDDYDEEEFICQKLGFALSDRIRLELLGSYELKKDTLDGIACRLSYSNNCCYDWTFTYKDDRSGNDSWASLRFGLTALPDSTVKFGDNELEDPFEEPGDLPE